MIINPFNLHKTASGWHFETEEVLEDFMFLHLEQVLGLTGLARQYIVQGQRCDILAVDSTKRLVVLELKNSEDRGIVQQLTRYYHVLLEEKPFQEQINYDLPVHLVAIAPSFHRDNLIDRQYHKLELIFLEFKILEDSKDCYVLFKDLEKGNLCQIKLLHKLVDKTINVAQPPIKLMNALRERCPESLEREAILKIRHKILSFDYRMKEIVQSNRIEYGKNKNNICAEIYLRSTSWRVGKPALFLRLPKPAPWAKLIILRMYVFNDDLTWNTFNSINHYPRAFISSKNANKSLWQYPSFIEVIKRVVEQNPQDENALKCYQRYKTMIELNSNSIELLIDIALETWLSRL